MAAKVSIACMDDFQIPCVVPRHDVESTSDDFYFVYIVIEVDIPYNVGDRTHTDDSLLSWSYNGVVLVLQGKDSSRNIYRR